MCFLDLTKYLYQNFRTRNSKEVSWRILLIDPIIFSVFDGIQIEFLIHWSISQILNNQYPMMKQFTTFIWEKQYPALDITLIF
jgi:hypothetical protein